MCNTIYRDKNVSNAQAVQESSSCEIFMVSNMCLFNIWKNRLTLFGPSNVVLHRHVVTSGVPCSKSLGFASSDVHKARNDKIDSQTEYQTWPEGKNIENWKGRDREFSNGSTKGKAQRHKEAGCSEYQIKKYEQEWKWTSVVSSALSILLADLKAARGPCLFHFEHIAAIISNNGPLSKECGCCCWRLTDYLRHAYHCSTTEKYWSLASSHAIAKGRTQPARNPVFGDTILELTRLYLVVILYTNMPDTTNTNTFSGGQRKERAQLNCSSMY